MGRGSLDSGFRAVSFVSGLLLLGSQAAADCTLKWSVSGGGNHYSGTERYPAKEACVADRLQGVDAIKQIEPTLREMRRLGSPVNVTVGDCVCVGAALNPWGSPAPRVPPPARSQRDPRDERRRESDQRGAARPEPRRAEEPADGAAAPPSDRPASWNSGHEPVYQEINPEPINPVEQTQQPLATAPKGRHSPGAYRAEPAAPPQVDDLFKSGEEPPSNEGGPWLCGTHENPLPYWTCPRCGAQIPCNEPAVVQHSNYECPKRPGASPPPGTSDGASGDAVNVGGTELRESQYFYDLQMRRTGPAGVGRPDASPAPSTQAVPTPSSQSTPDGEAGPVPSGASPSQPEGRESTLDVFRPDPSGKPGDRKEPGVRASALPTASSDDSCREYTEEYENAVVQGTSWIVGLNLRRQKDKLRPEAERMLFDQLRIAGRLRKEDVENVEDLRRKAREATVPQKAAAEVDAAKAQTAALGRVFKPKDYDFMIGVAARHDAFMDLLQRVATGDEFTNGAFSASTQSLYASLKGRSFRLLNCHSNGAMVCLAALTGDCPDAKAVDVRLFGPQITPSSLREWQRLLDSGRVRSVAIYINRGDPIAPASFALAGGVAAGRAGRRVGLGVPAGLGVASALLLSYESLRGSINVLAPGVSVTFFDFCPEKERQMDIFGESKGTGRSLEDSTGTFEPRPQASPRADTPRSGPSPRVQVPETNLGWTIWGGFVGLFPELLGYDVTFACHEWKRYERLLEAQKLLKAKYGTESGVR